MRLTTFLRHKVAGALAASQVLLPALVPQSVPEKIEWISDLKFFEAELAKAHVDAFHALKREQFHDMVHRLIARASESTDRQMVAGLMRITAAIGDSHSGIGLIPANLRFTKVPIGLYLFGDQLGIMACAPAYQDLIGGSVISINGHPAKAVVQHMKLLTEGSNDMTRSAFVVTRLICPELLYYEGFAERPDQYDLVVQKDGKTIARSLPDLGRQPDG